MWGLCLLVGVTLSPLPVEDTYTALQRALIAHAIDTMPRTFEAPSGPSQARESESNAPLVPKTIPVPRSGTRYGLMNIRGEYFSPAYRYSGKWREWSAEPTDAHAWVSLDRCADAAKVWLATHGESLTVVLL